MATGKDQRSHDPEGVEGCACATGSCAISAIEEPFHWK